MASYGSVNQDDVESPSSSSSNRCGCYSAIYNCFSGEDNLAPRPGPTTTIRVHPEAIRFFSYLSFWLMVGFAMWMSSLGVYKLGADGEKIYVDVDSDNTDLVAVFGYNNVSGFENGEKYVVLLYENVYCT